MCLWSYLYFSRGTEIPGVRFTVPGSVRWPLSRGGYGSGGRRRGGAWGESGPFTCPVCTCPGAVVRLSGSPILPPEVRGRWAQGCSPLTRGGGVGRGERRNETKRGVVSSGKLLLTIHKANNRKTCMSVRTSESE